MESLFNTNTDKRDGLWFFPFLDPTVTVLLNWSTFNTFNTFYIILYVLYIFMTNLCNFLWLICVIFFWNFYFESHTHIWGTQSGRGVKIYTFKKVLFSSFFQHDIAGLGVLIPKRHHMLGVGPWKVGKKRAKLTLASAK